VFGPGLTGLSNLGNRCAFCNNDKVNVLIHCFSCYMASVMQTLFSLPAFQNRYHPNDRPSASSHWSSCNASLPADCVDCQMFKLADGLLSGRYSYPASHIPQHPTDPLMHDSPTSVFQEGIKPTGFKALIGKGHEEFSTMRQQDSEEFLSHLLTVLRRYSHSHPSSNPAPAPEPTEIFAFGMEQRLQCGECKGVRYRTDEMDVVSVPVPAKEKGKDAEGKVEWEQVKLEECLDGLTGAEALEYACPNCKKNVIAIK
jgi:ubiquitin carboxyl-terminal hydrolase 5/13